MIGMHEAHGRASIWLLDQPVHKLSKSQRSELQKRNIGFVFQSYHLLDDLTVYENLELPLSYRNLKRHDRESIVCDMLDRFRMVGKRICTRISSQAVSSSLSGLPVR